jgi:anti-sigma B factor antagonist
MMSVENLVRGEVAVVVLDGILDSRTAVGVQEELDQVTAQHGLVLLDLSRMSYLSSAGLRVLLLLYREAERTGVRVVLAGVAAEVHEVMAATGFADFFTMVDTVDDGVEVLTS